MVERVFEPIKIAYQGLFADDHLVDAQHFGKSLVGISKITTNITHLIFFQEIVKDQRAYQIRFFVGPSRRNGLLQELVAIMNSGMMPLFTPIVLKTAKPLVEALFKAALNETLKNKHQTNSAIDSICDLAKSHVEFARQVHNGHMRDKAWLQELVEKLSFENKNAFREAAEPVGKSVRKMIVGEADLNTIIDEPSAEVLRSKEGIEVGNVDTYDVCIEGVFKTNGACRIRLLKEDRVVPGKITDPELGAPGNKYTVALNEGVMLKVTAKPTLKDGNLHKLFISDAELISK